MLRGEAEHPGGSFSFIMKRLAGLLVPLGLLLAWYITLAPTFLGGPAEYVVVSGRSMEPTLYSRDLAILRQQSTYHEGDVIAFQVPGGSVIHRIVGGNAAEGFVTRGDNNDWNDWSQPTPATIKGELWFHLPNVGGWLGSLSAPAGIAVVAAISAMMLPTAQRARRRRGRHMHSHDTNSSDGPTPRGGVGQWWPGSITMLAGLVAAAALVVAFVAIGFVAFRSDPERTEYVERLAYEHTATFDYAVETGASTLYPGGHVEPVEQEDGTLAPPQPIYTQLARSMSVDFTYALQSNLPPQLSGEVGADLVIRADDGWTRTQTLMSPRPFEGETARGSVTIDLPSIQALVAQIEEETGFAPSTYTLSVEPTVTVAGNLGAEPIDETYTPTFEIQYDETQITPATTLAAVEPVSLGDDVVRANEIGVLGLELTVQTWRWLTLAGALVALVMAGVIATVVCLGLGQGEQSQIHARYRSMLVPVESNGSNAFATSIHVANMGDLARLARRDGGIIFHEPGPYQHRYFVRDGEDTYDYTVAVDDAARSQGRHAVAEE